MYLFLKTIYKCLFLFLRFILAIIDVVLFPVFYIFRIGKKRIRYFSVIGFNYLYARPQAFCKYLSKNGYNITYSFVKDKNITNYNDNSNNETGKIIVKDFIYNDNNKIFNRILLLFKSLFINYDIVIITHPTQTIYLDLLLIKLKGTKIIYDCMDYYEYWINKKDIKYFHIFERKLLRYASKITTSSNHLKEYLKNYYGLSKEIKVVKNGYEEFNDIRKEVELKHPNIMYIGSVDDYFDFSTIKNYFTHHKNYYFYVIGPITKNAQKNIKNLPKNILLLNAIEHSDIPIYANSADILVMPRIINNVTKCINPIKLYEYLSFGKPVISSYWDELNEFKDFVNFYHDDKSFDQALRKSINEHKIDENKLKQFLKKALWKNRVKEFIQYIQ